MTSEKLDAHNRELFTIVYACDDILHNCEEDFSRIADRVEGGVEAYHEAKEKLDWLVTEVIRTIPPKQCLTIAKQMEVSEIRVSTKPAHARDAQHWAIDREALAVLTEAAIANTCLLCDGKKQKCELRGVIEELPLDIEDLNVYMACREGELEI